MNLNININKINCKMMIITSLIVFYLNSRVEVPLVTIKKQKRGFNLIYRKEMNLVDY